MEERDSCPLPCLCSSALALCQEQDICSEAQPTTRQELKALISPSLSFFPSFLVLFSSPSSFQIFIEHLQHARSCPRCWYRKAVAQGRLMANYHEGDAPLSYDPLSCDLTVRRRGQGKCKGPGPTQRNLAVCSGQTGAPRPAALWAFPWRKAGWEKGRFQGKGLQMEVSDGLE